MCEIDLTVNGLVMLCRREDKGRDSPVTCSISAVCVFEARTQEHVLVDTPTQAVHV